MNNFLNKELNFSFKGFPIDKILGAIASSIIYSMLISYFIYNIIVFINPLEFQLIFLGISNNYNLSDSIDIFKNQDLILSRFYNFIINAIQLDFGNYANSNRFINISLAFRNTLVFLFTSLAFGMMFSVVLLSLRKIRWINKTIIKLLCNISLLHIALIFLFFDNFIVNFTNPEFPYAWKIIFCSIIISLGSGMLLDFYNLIKEEYDNTMRKDYIQFAKDSGFNPFRFALKELSFNLISITISRIPLIFGGLIIIEHKMRDDNLEGISTFIFDRLDTIDSLSVFSAVFVCIVFFTTIFFVSQKIKESIIQK